jgi:hypothetical protein
MTFILFMKTASSHTRESMYLEQTIFIILKISCAYKLKSDTSCNFNRPTVKQYPYKFVPAKVLYLFSITTSFVFQFRDQLAHDKFQLFVSTRQEHNCERGKYTKRILLWLFFICFLSFSKHTEALDSKIRSICFQRLCLIKPNNFNSLLRKNYTVLKNLVTGYWGEYLDPRGRKWREAGEDCIMRSL